MTCYLASPYQDELLYSVIARHLVHTGATNPRAVSAQVFGRFTNTHVDMPCSLNEVSKQTWATWEMTSEEIFNHLTLFPYYTRYLSKSRRNKCFDVASSDYGTGMNGCLGLVNNRVKMPKYLRYCKSCKTNDMEEFGETYWHRVHQLQGVLVCPEHGEFLIETSAKMKPIEVPYYIDATSITDSETSNNTLDINSLNFPKYLILARRCREILNGSIKEWPEDNITTRYRTAALEKGFGHLKSITKLSQKQLSNAFCSFYGNNFLISIGCVNSWQSVWFPLLFHKFHEHKFLPIEHALIQIFLEHITSNTYDQTFGVGPWQCPNPLSEHVEPFPITRIKIRRRPPDDTPVATATCTCGYVFNFRHTAPNDSSLPIVSRVTEYGSTYRAKIISFLNEGLTLSSICKELGIYWKAINKILHVASKLPIERSKQIEQLRVDWLALLKITPGRNRTLARMKNDSLFSKLYKYDKEWLYSEKCSRTKNAHAITVSSQDINWSIKLKQAAADLKETFPVRRAMKNSIVIKAGLPRSIINKAKQFPRCHKILEEASESLHDYQIRKVVTVANKSHAQGIYPKRYELKRLIHHKVSPEIESIIQDLTFGDNQ